MRRTPTALAAAFALLALTAMVFTGHRAVASMHGGEDHKHETKNIVETAAANEEFSTLVAAVKAADLVDALSDPAKKYTVFAPTNDAFKKLPDGTLESLLKPENKEQLRSILLYHVTPGEHKAAQVVKKEQIKTLQGQTIDIKVADHKVMVDQAVVKKTDITATNGVIHVIDAVILPQAE